MAELKDIAFLISSTSDVSEVLPALFYLGFAQKKKPFSILGVFFVVSAIIKVFTLVTAELSIHNMPAYHLLAAIEIISVYCFYNLLVLKKIFFQGVAALFLIQVVNTAFFQEMWSFNSIAWTINMMLMIMMGLIFFFKIYKEDDGDRKPLENRPDFIITCGWLMYASGSLFTYLMGTEILSGKPEGFFKNAWIFQCFSNIIKNIIISYGFLLTKKNV